MAQVLLATGLSWVTLGILLDLSGAIIGGLIASLGYSSAFIFHRSGLHRAGRASWVTAAIFAVVYGALHLPAGGYILAMLTAAIPLLSLSFDWKTEKGQLIACYSLIAAIQAGGFYLFPDRLASNQAGAEGLESLIAVFATLTILGRKALLHAFNCSPPTHASALASIRWSNSHHSGCCPIRPHSLHSSALSCANVAARKLSISSRALNR